MLVLQRITNDGGTQMRAGMDPETIKEYQEAIDNSEAWPFPPVIVYHDGDRYWLADGFHWSTLHRSGKYLDIPADIRAAAARCRAARCRGECVARSAPHKGRQAAGCRDTRAGWRMGKWSNREIARRCSVSEHFVRDIKRGFGH